MRINEAIKEIIFQAKNDELENLQIIHGLSLSESQKVRGFFRNINQAVVDELEVKSTRLKDIDYTLSKIRSTQIQAGESSDEIKRLFDKQNDLAQSIGSLKEKRNILDFQNSELRREIEAINAQITKWADRANLNEDQRKRMAYCEKLQTVIQDFQKQFQAKRTEDLQKAILEMWNTLAHKDRLVRTVQVLPENNFAVELFDASGNKLDKTKLSAGEKEIYAIALLWALVQVSGRVMPIIIDTPFGRLDSLHRGNLVRKYFPKASHQVILLSQDEEIVDEYYKQIKPYIAKELTIEYINGESFVREGYPFTQHEVA